MDALHNRFSLKPSFPPDIDRISIDNLCLGAYTVNLTIKKEGSGYRLERRDVPGQVEIILNND